MHSQRRAFTLIELLVVIAIIALIIGVLLPALSGARERGMSLKCQTNIRELTRSSLCYNNEFGKLPPCLDNYAASLAPYNNGDAPGLDWLGIGNQSGPTIIPGDPNDPWTGNPKGFAAAPKYGLIYKYYRNEKMILCPSDPAGPYIANELTPPGNGKFSYTMMSAGVSLHSPDRIPADAAFAGTARSASLAPMFMEEHPEGINNDHAEGNFGAFRGWNQPPPPDGGDHLVSRHGPRAMRPGIKPGGSGVTQFMQGRSNIGYCDGHVEEVQPNFGFGRTQATTLAGYTGMPNFIAGILYRAGVKFEVAAFNRW